MKSITLATVAVLAGCASERIHQPQTSNATSEKVYHTQTSNPTSEQVYSNPTGLAVLVGSDAKIESGVLVWSCVYQTAEGRVVVQQREECRRAR